MRMISLNLRCQRFWTQQSPLVGAPDWVSCPVSWPLAAKRWPTFRLHKLMSVDGWYSEKRFIPLISSDTCWYLLILYILTYSSAGYKCWSKQTLLAKEASQHIFPLHHHLKTIVQDLPGQWESVAVEGFWTPNRLEVRLALAGILIPGGLDLEASICQLNSLRIKVRVQSMPEKSLNYVTIILVKLSSLDALHISSTWIWIAVSQDLWMKSLRL